MTDVQELIRQRLVSGKLVMRGQVNTCPDGYYSLIWHVYRMNFSDATKFQFLTGEYRSEDMWVGVPIPGLTVETLSLERIFEHVLDWQEHLNSWYVGDPIAFTGNQRFRISRFDKDLYFACMMIWQAAVARFSDPRWEEYGSLFTHIRDEFLLENRKQIRRVVPSHP